jgi:hypothetical protein
MGLKLSIAGLLSLGLVASACATQTHETARADEAATLANAETMHATAIGRVGAQAASWGDRWAAANLFERATDKEGKSVRLRFDLATTYARTGRVQEAERLYADLIHDGQYTVGVTDPDLHNRGRRLVRFNVGEESARRLAILQQRRQFAANTGAGAVAAGEFGTPTSAVVGETPVVEHRIPDRVALSRDAAEQP